MKILASVVALVIVGLTGGWLWLDATAQAGETQRQLSLEAEESLRATMESEGVTFADADRDAYIEATAPVYDKYAQSFPELVEALRAAAGQ